MKISKGYITYETGGARHVAEFDLDRVNELEGIVVTPSCATTDAGSRLTVKVAPRGTIEIIELSLEGTPGLEQGDTVFCNGYQTWTDSREYDTDERMKKLFYPAGLLYKLNWYGDYHFYDYSGSKGRLHGYTYTYIKKKGHAIDFVGSLSEDTGYTIFEYDTKKNRITIRKECEGMILLDETTTFDLALFQGNERPIFELYFKMLSCDMATTPLCTGWTSWYNYYTDISEDIILSNLEDSPAKRSRSTHSR